MECVGNVQNNISLSNLCNLCFLQKGFIKVARLFLGYMIINGFMEIRGM